jgi:hypothetical protein
MTYGVFILKNGSWVLHLTCASKSSADQEAKYLTEMLGLTATVFVKIKA